MSGQADRTVDEVLRELSEKYGSMFNTESPARTKIPLVMSPRPSAVSPFDNLSNDFTNPYAPAHVSSFPSAHVPPFPFFSAPPVPTNTAIPFSPLPAHESMQFPNPGVSFSSQSSIFGRKALTPPALSHFAPDQFRTWLDLFTEFLERFV